MLEEDVPEDLVEKLKGCKWGGKTVVQPKVLSKSWINWKNKAF
jgi:hypothetical protein